MTPRQFANWSSPAPMLTRRTVTGSRLSRWRAKTETAPSSNLFWPLAQKPETAKLGYINVSLTAIIMIAAVIILVDSIRRWLGGGRRKEPITQDTPLPSISAWLCDGARCWVSLAAPEGTLNNCYTWNEFWSLSVSMVQSGIVFCVDRQLTLSVLIPAFLNFIFSDCIHESHYICIK